VIGDRVANTGVLALATLAVLIPLSLVLGVLTAIRRGSGLDLAIQMVLLGAIAVPEFVVGVGMLLLFGYVWGALPAVSLTVSVRTLIMPVLSLLAISLAYTVRMVRAGVVDVLDSEYVAMARLKGLPERLVILRHVVRNALVPGVQALALTIAWLPGGIVVIEYLFGYPGVGSALVEAIHARDNATVQALTAMIAGVYVIANLFSDIFALAATPRLRSGSL
jgi:peptide/nickel transport system permease protein